MKKIKKKAYSEVYAIKEVSITTNVQHELEQERDTRSSGGGISVDAQMTITYEDILAYVNSLSDDAILPHPNRSADKEDGLLATVLRCKYAIPASQRIWESGSYNWLEIHAPGKSVSSSTFTKVFTSEEAKILGQRYYNYFDRYVDRMMKSEFNHFLEYSYR